VSNPTEKRRENPASSASDRAIQAWLDHLARMIARHHARRSAPQAAITLQLTNENRTLSVNKPGPN
jgi:hypothetical protein